MSTEKPIWQEHFTVRTYELDPTGQASILTICNYLQDVAENNAFHLGFSMNNMLDKKRTWVLSRLHVQMERYPQWKELLTVETWPSGANRLYGIRDFRIRDKTGTLLGRATTAWAMFNLETRRPVRIPPQVEDAAETFRGRAIDDSFPKLPQLNQVDHHRVFTVRHSDLDVNQHVNHVSYIDWAMEAVPPLIWEYHQLRAVEVHFRAECFYGDRVISQCQHLPQPDGHHFLHQVRRKEDDQEITRLRTIWRKV
ncbi:MAG: hypothetical protein D6675_11185 [Gemmatimonadetes bacterium]|nr:MAG: hypothetical protein D6675_11185 [Gemmatimonadota bacterium]